LFHLCPALLCRWTEIILFFHFSSLFDWHAHFQPAKFAAVNLRRPSAAGARRRPANVCFSIVESRECSSHGANKKYAHKGERVAAFRLLLYLFIKLCDQRRSTEITKKMINDNIERHYL
jgi:hypothetical protein